ncbi:uncharacterized protein E5676_scaffold66G00450 [Cucumis melo var. makuwa]|uniref:Flocculation protein FLO11-like n=1 Tax=Cucumis melo var. makuwa TaxID=1194695 RepID=A0A5D3CIW9_CUCMM|nr:uncharacterized protein E5676_scaffold66G00450 [Cucumis melo var. makuwa]
MLTGQDVLKIIKPPLVGASFKVRINNSSLFIFSPLKTLRSPSQLLFGRKDFIMVTTRKSYCQQHFPPMSDPSFSANPTSIPKRYKIIHPCHPYRRLRHASDLPPTSSSSKSIEILYEQYATTPTSRTFKTPPNYSTTTISHVSRSATSKPYSQRKPKVIISDSELEEVVVVESVCSSEDHVIFANVLKRKATVFSYGINVPSSAAPSSSQAHRSTDDPLMICLLSFYMSLLIIKKEPPLPTPDLSHHTVALETTSTVPSSGSIPVPSKNLSQKMYRVPSSNQKVAIISDQHCFCKAIFDLIIVVGLLPTIIDVGPFYYSLT